MDAQVQALAQRRDDLLGVRTTTTGWGLLTFPCRAEALSVLLDGYVVLAPQGLRPVITLDVAVVLQSSQHDSQTTVGTPLPLPLHPPSLNFITQKRVVIE